MKQIITSLFLMGIILFYTGSLKAQVSNPASLNVYLTTGPITVDGNLNEPDWSAPMPYLMFRIHGTPSGTANTPTDTDYVVVKPPYMDTTTTTVKFLRSGMDLYIGVQSNDKQICKYDWEGDGIFMKLKNGLNLDAEFHLFVINKTTFGAESGGAAIPVGGYAGAAIVNGTIFDSSDVDNGYTAEGVIHLDSMKYSAVPATIAANVVVFDPDNYSWDGVAPRDINGAHGNYTKQWWGTEWGNDKTLNLINAVLPVELTSFAGVSDRAGIKLSWATATETNNRGFEIQRSLDKNNFISVGFIAGKGTTSRVSEYSYVDKNINTGVYYYRLKQVDFDGTFKYSAVISVNSIRITNYELAQNYPNPFNPSTSIKYSIPDDNLVSLKVYNVLGNEVATLVNEQMQAGLHEVTFNAANLSSGVYFYTITAGKFTATKKLMLLK